MSLESLTEQFPWYRYSSRLTAKIERPRSGGFFTKEASLQRGMRCVFADEGSIDEGNRVRLYWLVDPEDGTIVDAKFQAFGQSALIGAAEAACEIVIGKNYDQAARVGGELIDKHLRDKSDTAAFPEETLSHLNLIVSALDSAAEQCRDIPLSPTYVAPPAPADIGEVLEGGYPGWQTFTLQQKLGLIEEVLDRDVRPYIALDGGGVELLDLKQDNQVCIAYQGTCTSCFASAGTTLSYIQQVLQAKVHPSLEVIPQL